MADTPKSKITATLFGDHPTRPSFGVLKDSAGNFLGTMTNIEVTKSDPLSGVQMAEDYMKLMYQSPPRQYIATSSGVPNDGMMTKRHLDGASYSMTHPFTLSQLYQLMPNTFRLSDDNQAATLPGFGGSFGIPIIDLDAPTHRDLRARLFQMTPWRLPEGR